MASAGVKKCPVQKTLDHDVYYDILMLGRTGLGKSTTANNLLGVGRASISSWGIDLVEGAVRLFETGDGLESVTHKCKVLSNEHNTRVLDTPGFADTKLTSKYGLFRSNLQIFRWILRDQEKHDLAFRRVLYFLPFRGAPERAEGTLQEEIKVMYEFLGQDIFNIMVIVATNKKKFQTNGFDEDDKSNTEKAFTLAFKHATGQCLSKCPPILYLPYDKTDVLMRIARAKVISDEPLKKEKSKQPNDTEDEPSKKEKSEQPSDTEDEPLKKEKSKEFNNTEDEPLKKEKSKLPDDTEDEPLKKEKFEQPNDTENEPLKKEKFKQPNDTEDEALKKEKSKQSNDTEDEALKKEKFKQPNNTEEELLRKEKSKQPNDTEDEALKKEKFKQPNNTEEEPLRKEKSKQPNYNEDGHLKKEKFKQPNNTEDELLRKKKSKHLNDAPLKKETSKQPNGTDVTQRAQVIRKTRQRTFGTKLHFPHRCTRCAAKLIHENSPEGKQLAVKVVRENGDEIPIEHSKCHPVFIPKYSALTKAIGGILHVATLGLFTMIGKLHGKDIWPGFMNSDESCPVCGLPPGSEGCSDVGKIVAIPTIRGETQHVITSHTSTLDKIQAQKMQLEVQKTCGQDVLYDILLLGRTGMGKSTTANKLLGVSGRENITLWGTVEGAVTKFFEAGSGIEPIAKECKLLSNKHNIRVLDTPGFVDFELTQEHGLLKGNSQIFLSILQKQEKHNLAFHRVLYFLPFRGPPERADGTLQEEIKVMYEFLGIDVFNIMVIIATSSRKYQAWGFNEYDIHQTEKVFTVAFERVTGQSLPKCPPVLYLPFEETDVLSKIGAVKVISDFPHN